MRNRLRASVTITKSTGCRQAFRIYRIVLPGRGFCALKSPPRSTHLLMKTGYLPASPPPLIQDDIRDESVQLSASHNAVPASDRLLCGSAIRDSARCHPHFYLLLIRFLFRLANPGILPSHRDTLIVAAENEREHNRTSRCRF